MLRGISARPSLAAYLPGGLSVPVFVHVVFGGNLSKKERNSEGRCKDVLFSRCLRETCASTCATAGNTQMKDHQRADLNQEEPPGLALNPATR